MNDSQSSVIKANITDSIGLFYKLYKCIANCDAIEKCKYFTIEKKHYKWFSTKNFRNQFDYWYRLQIGIKGLSLVRNENESERRLISFTIVQLVRQGSRCHKRRITNELKNFEGIFKIVNIQKRYVRVVKRISALESESRVLIPG